VKPGTLLWRRIFNDESLKDLAEDFRLPLGTVKSRLHHEGALLRRRLQDWRRDRLGQDPSCAHFRRGVLGVQPCPRCAEEQVVWEAMRARSRAYRAFQAASVTVESAFSVWFDCAVQVTRWEEGDAGYCPVGLGPRDACRTGAAAIWEAASARWSRPEFAFGRMPSTLEMTRPFR
jgi:hypothetical protein